MIVKYQVQIQYLFVLVMSVTKVEESYQESFSRTTVAKKEKIGRWSNAECYLFQSLLERFGKNWRKIQQHMKNRSLSQIRSHAQKYFDKIGPKKVEEFQRRAELLQAYQTLQKEKQLRLQMSKQTATNLSKPELEAKQEEESPSTQDAIIPQNTLQVAKESINKNEQQIKPSENLQEEKCQTKTPETYYPFLNSFNLENAGYLLQIIGLNPQPFFQFQGIQPYVDSPGFRASVFKN